MSCPQMPFVLLQKILTSLGRDNISCTPCWVVGTVSTLYSEHGQFIPYVYLNECRYTVIGQDDSQ